jgi:hypothetical protein
MKLAALAVAVAVVSLTAGCASDRSDWFRIHHARAAVGALSQTEAATRAPGDVARVEAELGRAERALEDGRGADVAQIAQLALLRARIVRLGASEALVKEDIADAESSLAAAKADVEASAQELQAAKSDLEALNED